MLQYGLETKLNAHALYVHDLLSTEEVAAMVGVSTQTIRNWVRKGDWKKQRKDIEKQTMAISTAFMDSLYEMTQELAKDKDPQRAHAVSNMMRAMPSARRLNASLQRAEVSKVILGGILEHLHTHTPDIYETASRAILAFVDRKRDLFQLRANQIKILRLQVETDAATLVDLGKKHGLDPATIKQIREEIYGLVDDGDDDAQAA